MDFSFLANLEKAEEIDGKYFVSGIASTTDRDEQGDILTEKCLKEMANTAVGVNVVQSHSNNSLDSIGSIVESNYDDNKLFIKAELDADDPLAVRTWKKIQKSKKIGFSIGANIKKLAKSIDNKTRLTVDSVLWNHVAIVSNPANKNTLCMALNKAIEDDMATENTTTTISTEVPPVTDPIEKAGATFSSANKASLKAIHDSGDAIVKSKVREMLGSDADETLGSDETVAPASSTSESLIGVIDKSAIDAAVAAQFATAIPEIVKQMKIELAKSITPTAPIPTVSTAINKALDAHPNDIGLLLRSIAGTPS